LPPKQLRDYRAKKVLLKLLWCCLPFTDGSRRTTRSQINP